MSIETTKFARKPFYVDAVQVTEQNISDVAKWCNGDIRKDNQKVDFIKVRVNRPLNERQTQAYVGDWVLYAGTGYKVYTPKAFEDSFESAENVNEIQHANAGRYIYRDSADGQLVSAEYAADNPNTTTREWVPGPA
jgi:hypothetical protein